MKASNEKCPDIRLVKSSEYIAMATLLRGDDPDGLDDTYIDNAITEQLVKYGALFVNDTFLPLFSIKSGILMMYGGYGSSKTTTAIQMQLIKSLRNPYHRCYYGRLYKEDARKLHKSIIDCIKRCGWDDYFEYSDSPTGHTTITCNLNNNSFVAFGCDDDESTKGIPDASDILIDEVNQLEFGSFGMVLSRLRKPGVPLQLTCMFNNCDVKPGHWLRRLVFNDEVPEQSEITPDERKTFDALQKRKIVKHKSVFTDNLFLNHKAYDLVLMVQAQGNEARYKAIRNGDWAEDDVKMPYYSGFNQQVHVRKVEYDPRLPLWLGLDENYNPYLPLGIFQIDGKHVKMLMELPMEQPRNNVDAACQAVMQHFGPLGYMHDAGMIITGDRTSKKEDGKLEAGQNFFTLFEERLAIFNPRTRLDNVNPSVNMRAAFINAVFRGNFDGVTITIDPSCRTTIMDFLNVEYDPKGTGKDKRLRTMDIGGVKKRVQKYGHFSDIFEYVLCMAMKGSYIRFQQKGITFEAKAIGKTVRNGFGGGSNRIGDRKVSNRY